MYIVYVLRDARDGKLYKGMTNNLSRRLKEHRCGKTRTTKNMKDIRVAYREEYKDAHNARKRELYFKSAAGRKFIKKILFMPR